MSATAYIVLIGDVKAKDYQNIRFKLLQEKKKPKIIRLGNEFVGNYIKFMSGQVITGDEIASRLKISTYETYREGPGYGNQSYVMHNIIMNERFKNQFHFDPFQVSYVIIDNNSLKELTDSFCFEDFVGQFESAEIIDLDYPW